MKTKIPPNDHIDRLKIAALYLSEMKGLPPEGWASVFWGTFNLIGVLVALSVRHGKAPELLGVLLLLLGLFRLGGLQALGLAMLAVGLLNTFGDNGLIILGIAQLVWAFKIFSAYSSAEDAAGAVEKLELTELETYLPTWGNQGRGSEDVVEFGASDKAWKLRLLPEIVIGLTQNGRRIVVARREELALRAIGEALLSKNLKVKLAIEDVSLDTQTKTEYFGRLEKWRTGSTPTALAVSA